MKARVFGCKKFGRLSSEQADRELTDNELRFLDKHRAVCSECTEQEETASRALNMLRMATLEPEITPMFEDRVIRKLRVQQVKESLNYWSPALIGAGIACIVIFVTLHLAANPARTKDAHYPDGEARHMPSHNLELDQIPVLR